MQKLLSGKKVIVIIITLLMLFSITACSNSEADGTETITLSLGHFFPSTHPAESVFVSGWIDAISEATNGSVVITSYPGGTLVGAADTYSGVIDGIADIGLSCFSYTRGSFPVLEAFELPGIIYKNSKVASKVAWEGIKELNPEETQDTHLMMVIATGPGDLFTKDPINTLDDLQGFEIRASGLSATTIETLGGIPVGMPQSDAYESLSKGIVKGNLSPVEVLKGWNHAEVTDYLTMTPFLYNTLFFVTMNNEVWDSIPEDLQVIITETTETFYNEVGIGLWDMQNEAGMDFAKEQGLEIITLSDEEAAKWIDKVSPMHDAYNDSIKDITSVDVLQKVKDLANKYNDVY